MADYKLPGNCLGEKSDEEEESDEEEDSSKDEIEESGEEG
jgi:hypothetical protein